MILYTSYGGKSVTTSFSFCYTAELYSKPDTYENNLFFICGIFDLSNDRVYQVNLWVFPSISLGRSFEENVRRYCLALCGEMRDEIRRLMSFAGIRVDASPIRLSEAGFFATGVGDETMCFSCGTMHRGWQWSNDPATVHRNISPGCLHASRHDDRNTRPVPFRLPAPGTAPLPWDQFDSLISTTDDAISPNEASLGLSEEEQLTSQGDHPDPEQSRSTENICRGIGPEIRQVTDGTRHYPETVTSEINSDTHDFQVHNAGLERCVYPKYNALIERLNSYQRWPQAHCKKPEDLAKAGFFYAGYGDCVRCFCCGVGLKTWVEGDDPWEEHVRWRSLCDYVRSVKGEEFVNTIRGKINETEKMDHSETTKPSSQSTAEAEYNTCKNACRLALDMGFNPDCVLDQLHKIVQEYGADKLNPELLISSLKKEYANSAVSVLHEDCDGMADVQLQDGGKEEDMRQDDLKDEEMVKEDIQRARRQRFGKKMRSYTL